MERMRMIAKTVNRICADLLERGVVLSAVLVSFLFFEIFPVIFYSLIVYGYKRLWTLPFQVRQL